MVALTLVRAHVVVWARFRLHIRGFLGWMMVPLVGVGSHNMDETCQLGSLKEGRKEERQSIGSKVLDCLSGKISSMQKNSLCNNFLALLVCKTIHGCYKVSTLLK